MLIMKNKANFVINCYVIKFKLKFKKINCILLFMQTIEHKNINIYQNYLYILM